MYVIGEIAKEPICKIAIFSTLLKNQPKPLINLNSKP